MSDVVDIDCCGEWRYRFLKSTSGQWAMAPVNDKRRRTDTRAAFDASTSRRLHRREAKYADVGRLVKEAGDPVRSVTFRYNLRCEDCGRTVPARSEKLNPIFDLLAAAGLQNISLAGLAGRLGSSGSRH
jgi:ribosomal protein L44E